MAVAIVVIGFSAFHKGGSLGDSTVHNFPEWFYGGIQIGPTSNIIQNVITGKCTMTLTDTMSGGIFSGTCNNANARVGDKVFITPTLLTNTASMVVTAANVSTNGVIDAYFGEWNSAPMTLDVSYVLFRSNP